jgi:hypothetical protein
VTDESRVPIAISMMELWQSIALTVQEHRDEKKERYQFCIHRRGAREVVSLHKSSVAFLFFGTSFLLSCTKFGRPFFGPTGPKGPGLPHSRMVTQECLSLLLS